MKIIYLYYFTGTALVLLVLVLASISKLNVEDMIIFSLTGFLLIALGIIQHIITYNQTFFPQKNNYSTDFL